MSDFNIDKINDLKDKLSEAVDIMVQFISAVDSEGISSTSDFNYPYKAAQNFIKEQEQYGATGSGIYPNNTL